ncbi:cyclase family protein [Albimonas sp. CAU 1670]|uniref:cyclase family protein n=1 Tax=Albimonas sp. CAU 1670 TaxID=3032599 RepID=UPI0023D98508|nr:cyclase family protein [Albimonas sp. CAU 1670]MDF2234746.1 cyclase family protein [Albimonas sp. CAU 1670]
MTACVHDHSSWPAADALGACRLLTPQVTLAALSLVVEGRVLDLGQETMADAPRIPPNQTPYVMSMSARSASTLRARRAMGVENEVGSNLERVGMTMHVGTHIDALGHFTIGDRMFGGRSAEEVVADRGLTELGVEQIPPIVTRALVLDLAGLDGGEFLEAGRPIKAADLEAWSARAGLAPRDGDAVLIRTGWGRFYMTDNPRYVAGEPGIDLGAARWLTERGVVAIGADTMAVEVLPGTEHPRILMPVHQHCLVEAGVHLIENMALDGLAAEGAGEVCFIAAAPKFTGATGAPLRPLALV